MGAIPVITILKKLLVKKFETVVDAIMHLLLLGA